MKITASTRRLTLAAAFIALAVSATAWLHGQQFENRPLSSVFPPGALLYLEAKDFRSLLQSWQNSNEKKRWLSSANFGTLSRSRLIGRLAEAQTDFESVAGVPVELNLADQSAGRQSAFAFYDLSALTFLYVTRLDAPLLDANDLWRARASYQTRQVAGIDFFVKTDAATKRTACFASYQGWFLIATGEDQMAVALTLLAGGSANQASLSSESWFTQATHLSSAAGDLRLVYNLEKLLATPQFRTYWIQRNASELKPYIAGISDLSLHNNVWEEQRALMRQTPLAATQTARSLSHVLQYVPSTAALYRAWSAPDTSTISSVVQQVVFAESTQVESLDRYAPLVSTEAPQTGSASDLETRIDQPPLSRAHNTSVAPIVAAISGMHPVSLLHVQTTESLPGNVFVLPQSGLVLECERPDSAALEAALQASTTISQTGALDSLRISVAGRNLILSRLDLVSSNSFTQDSQGEFQAGYRHALEWPRYHQMFDILDRNPLSKDMQATDAQPPFFSGNLSSVGDTLSRLQNAFVSSHNEGDHLRETVRYEMAAQ